MNPATSQPDLFEEQTTRSLLDRLLEDSRLYKASKDYLVKHEPPPKEARWYRMQVNRNHAAPVQFVTIAHELAHLFLGHLGPDEALGITERPRAKHEQRELEAESVAYLVCSRNGVESKSQTYLTEYVSGHTTIEVLDIYQIMRATGQIEALLGLSAKTRY